MSSAFSYYRFTAPRSRDDAFRQKLRARDRKLGYAGYPLRLDQIAWRENLFECYLRVQRKGDKAPGVDGVRIVDLSNSEAGDCVGTLSNRILDGTYLPMPTRPVSIPKPGLSERRPLQLPCLADRILGAAVDEAFAELWSHIFLPCSYGFRRRRSVSMLLADLVAQMHAQDRWVLAVDDIRHAFDTAPIDDIVAIHVKYLDTLEQAHFGAEERAGTLRLIDTILRGVDRKKLRGICQGAPYSPTALNVLLHDNLDVPIAAYVDNKPLFYRYADNVVYLAESVTEGRQMLAKVSTLLDPLGMSLKGHGAEIIDLSNGGSAQLLGFSLQRQDGVIRLGIGQEAWNSLRQHLSDAHGEDDPSSTALEVVRGWIDAVGPVLESGDVVPQVLSIAAESGFREISGPILHRRWRKSYKRWLGHLKRARRRCRA